LKKLYIKLKMADYRKVLVKQIKSLAAGSLHRDESSHFVKDFGGSVAAVILLLVLEHYGLLLQSTINVEGNIGLERGKDFHRELSEN
jgi:hypothetical protein